MWVDANGVGVEDIEKLLVLLMLTLHSVMTRKGKDNEREMDIVEIMVFDNTHEAKLDIWEPQCWSAATWVPSRTVLLITNPLYRVERKNQISLEPSSFVDIDPAMQDAQWLREYALGKARREHVNPPCPENGMFSIKSIRRGRKELMKVVFDVESATTSETRILFTLADIDEL